MKASLILLLSPIIVAGMLWKAARLAFCMGGELFIEMWDAMP